MAALRRKRVAEGQPTEMEQFCDMVDDASMAKAWDVVLPFIRAGILRDTYHMEVDRMVRYTYRFGPMDWRHHASHALYWSARGIDEGFNRITKDNRRDFDTLNTDRITVQAVQDLFRSGELYFDFFAMTVGGKQGYAMFQGVPCAYFVPVYGDLVDDARPRSWADQLDNRGFSPLSGGYENFLRDAICFFYRRRQFKEAELWYSKLRNYGGLNLNNPSRKAEMSVPLDEFVNRELNDRATSPNVAVAQIAGALMGAFTSGLLAGDQELFDSQFEYAKRFHKYFFEQQRKAVIVNKQYVRMDQLEPDFRMATGAIFSQWIQSLGLDDAKAVYSRSPDSLKQFAYDILRASYQTVVDDFAAKSGGDKFAKVFPEPAGMDEFRVWLKQQAAARGREPPPPIS
jgi:hypothetical protein